MTARRWWIWPLALALWYLHRYISTAIYWVEYPWIKLGQFIDRLMAWAEGDEWQ